MTLATNIPEIVEGASKVSSGVGGATADCISAEQYSHGIPNAHTHPNNSRQCRNIRNLFNCRQEASNSSRARVLLKLFKHELLERWVHIEPSFNLWKRSTAQMEVL